MKCRVNGACCAGVLALIAAVCVSCAHQRVTWTPETVKPPETLEAAMEQVTGAAAQPAQPTPATPPETPAPAGAVQITRDGAILTALTNNRSLAVARYGPAVGETLEPEARAVFDPRFLATTSLGRDTSPISGISRYTVGRLLSGGGGLSVSDLVVPDDPDETFINVTQTLSELFGAQKYDPFIEAWQSSGTASVRNVLPTGTEVFLSGGVTRAKSNFTPEEYTGEWSVGVNQALLRGGGPAVNLVALRQARNNAAKTEHVFRNDLLQLVQQVETAYWDLVLARELLKIREFSVQLAEQQQQRTQDMVDVGRAIQGAVIAAKAEAESRRADLADARALVKTRTIALIRLLNPEGADEWRVEFDPADPPAVEQVAIDGDASDKLALLCRPELAQARLELANRELDVVRTQNGLLPRLDAFASYGRQSLGESLGSSTYYLDNNDYDNFAVGVSLEVPLLNRAERARYRRARFIEAQAEASVGNLEQLLEAEVRAAVVEVGRQWERVTSTRAAVVAREEQLRIQQDRFSVGMSTDLDVLLVQRDLIQAQVGEVTARVQYIQALTNLYKAEGTLLARRGVVPEEQWGSNG
ncbi:MAG: TolC family protein [Candidatus Hydrogenedentes bacterium]|nr:TolC family protein [Candidatus Hydrogenedentota bacterium]